MAEKRILGVQSIQVGDIASDGGASAAFAALGVTYEGTATLEQADAEDVEHFCEESDDPIEVLSGTKTTTVAWSIVDFTPETLVKVLGGAVKTGKWEAPDSASVIEKSVKIVAKKGPEIVFPRVSIKARIQYDIAKKGIAKVLITGKVLKPTKAGVASIIIG